MEVYRKVKYSTLEERCEAKREQCKGYYENKKDRYKLLMQKNQVKKMITKINTNQYIKAPKYTLEELETKLENLEEQLTMCC